MHPTKKSTAKRVGGGLMASAAALALTLTGTTAQAAAPPIATAVAGPTPEAQAWVDQNPFGMFLHYGPGTYSGAQWSDPNLPPTVFAPTATVDTDQWAASMKAAGMTFGVLTAKHHDGFALWPTAHSTYDIASSGYQGGQGDIVRDYVDSMREAGLKVGIYFSIWDQKNGNSTQLIKNQLQELLPSTGRSTTSGSTAGDGRSPTVTSPTSRSAITSGRCRRTPSSRTTITGARSTRPT